MVRVEATGGRVDVLVQDTTGVGLDGWMAVGVRVPVDGAETVDEPPPPPPPEAGGVTGVVTGMSVKVAPTDLARDMVVEQVPVVLVQAPFQPEKVESLDGVAVKVMVVPDVTDMEHVEPQFRPLPVMVPLPVFVAETVYVVTGMEAVVIEVGRERDDTLLEASYADTVNV